VATHHRDGRVAAARKRVLRLLGSSATVVFPSNRSRSRDRDRPNQRCPGSYVRGALTGEPYKRSWLGGWYLRVLFGERGGTRRRGWKPRSHASRVTGDARARGGTGGPPS
jgi:hypothetical protein